jgi:hypothetical protein
LVGADNTVLHTLHATVQDGGTWSASVPSSLVQGLADASVTVRASYTSLYGASVNANRSLVVDTTAPSLAVTTPSDTVLTAAEASAFGLDYTTSDSVTSAPARQVVLTNANGQVQNSVTFSDSLASGNGRVLGDLSGLADGGSRTLERLIDLGRGDAQQQLTRLDTVAQIDTPLSHRAAGAREDAGLLGGHGARWQTQGGLDRRGGGDHHPHHRRRSARCGRGR